MLAEGGSAVDAALATAITLTLVEPVSNGIGSDAFAIVWDGRQLHGLNASGRSPAAWTPEYFQGRRGAGAGLELGDRAGGGVGVGGAARQSSANVRSNGSSSRRSATAATDSSSRRRSPRSGRRRCRTCVRSPASPRHSCRAVERPRLESCFALPEHAETLEKIAATNGEAFYRGELAETMEAHSAANGGAMTGADLAAHRADWVDTITTDYRGYTLHELQPNGQGIVALVALGILEHFDMASLPVDSADSVHLQIEALKLAFADGLAYVADIDHMQVRPAQLLDKEYLRQRSTLIDRTRAKAVKLERRPGAAPYTSPQPTLLGMMVSMIQSNYMGFGSGVVVPGTGISLQNRGTGFVTAPGHPNLVGPNKRPYHTIIPGFMTKDGAP